MNDANNEFQTGLDLKTKGDFEKALTWFRRAAISDPKHVQAHLEIGRLCKDKARLEPHFLRYAFDSFRTAARLDLSNQEAHDQYIMLAQQMKVLDQLHDEYEVWAKQNPGNDVVQKSYKNLIAISMALFSPQVEVGKAKASGSMKNLIFFISIFTLIIGTGLIFLPPMFAKSGKLAKEHIKSFLTIGIVMCAGGLAGIIFHRRMD